MTSYTLTIPTIKNQLNNAINNIFHPDSTGEKLIQDFIKNTAATADDFASLLNAVDNINYSSEKAKINFSPIVTLLMSQSAHLAINTHTSLKPYTEKAFKIENDNNGVLITQCTKKIGQTQYDLNPLVHAITSKEQIPAAYQQCMEFSKLPGDHYLSLTGEESGCKGPYNSPDAYYFCISAL